MTRPDDSRDEVSALARGLALLRLVAQADRPLSHRDLADIAGLPKATVSRLAATLVGAGYLQRDDASEQFALGPGVMDLGNAYLRHFDLRARLRPILGELAELGSANVHLGIRDGLDILMIDTVRPRAAVVLSRMDIGSRMTIPTSAAGRAYLAALTPPERELLMEQIRQACGTRWRQVKRRLDEALQDYEELGYCRSFGEWHPEINALGFAVRGPRGELYAVSCGGPAFVLTPEVLTARLGERLGRLTRQESRQFAWTEPAHTVP